MSLGQDKRGWYWLGDKVPAHCAGVFYPTKDEAWRAAGLPPIETMRRADPTA